MVMRLYILLSLTFIGLCSNGQQLVPIKILSAENEALPANILIKEISQTFSADSSGIVLISFPANNHYTAIISAAAHEEQKIKIKIPFKSDTLIVTLVEDEEEMEEVIIQSTRTSRSIANVPTRIETIEFEEIDEKNNMRPANVAMILHESTGIQVQQTSATSANASIRIQGLDGRYTQLLKDGFPNYGNFSSGLSILEMPPLDLQQVEIIKGPASPLFGGGAIAGAVNFISKTPGEKPEYSFLFNQSNIGQSNIGAFAMNRGKKLGFTMMALYSKQKAFDVDDDDFTELPETNELSVHPTLFLYLTDKTTISIGNSFTTGKRTGGDIKLIENKPDSSHQYFEKNQTTRNVSSLQVEKKLNAIKRIILKQSYSVFDRRITMPSYIFAGVEQNLFTDLSYIVNKPKTAFVSGLNINYNHFNETNNGNGDRDYKQFTAGLYGQHTWDATDKLKLETGLRADISNYENSIYSKTAFFVLPRMSLLIKFDSKWSSRIGAGMGYKMPSIFTEETEAIQYRNVSQINNVKPELSYGGTADINLRTKLGESIVFTLNHMFFYTTINKPIILKNNLGLNYFQNASEPIHTGGFESNVKFIYKKNFKIFLGYTYTDVRAKYLTGDQFLPLVPKGKLNSALIYEKEGFIKLGLEGYFTGKQHLSNGSTAPAFEEFGFMAEKIFKRFSVYVNFENFTDTRQGRYKTVVNGSHLNPTFDEIWTHTEGFVFNAGIKLKF